jgi:hypothetical protein
MQIEDVKVTSRSNPSQRIIAAAIVFAVLYFASEVVITLLLAVLIAYFLDPVVGFFERIHIPRALGALVVLVAVTAMLAGSGYLVALRADQFLADWPRYSGVLRHVTTAFDAPLRRLPCASGCFEEWDRCTPFWSWRRSCHFWFSSCSPQNPGSGKPRLNYSRTNIGSAFRLPSIRSARCCEVLWPAIP